MHFRTILLALLALPLALNGCLFKTNEKVEAKALAPVALKSTDGCLSEGPKVAQQFLEGKVEDGQIDALSNCVVRSIDALKNMVRGAEIGVYSSEEIRGFLENYFVREANIPVGLFNEGMNLKRAMLGGSNHQVTLVELDRTRDLAIIVRDQLKLLRPFMPLQWSSVVKMGSTELDTFVSALENAGLALGQVIGNGGTSYSFENLDALMGWLEKMYDANERDNPIRLLRSSIPLLKLFKAAAWGSSDDRIDPHEWSQFFVGGAHGLYPAVSFSKTSDEKLDSYLSALDRALDFLRVEMQKHHQQRIAFNGVSPLWRALEDGVFQRYASTKLSNRQWLDGAVRLFNVKAALVGGDSASISCADIDALRSLIVVMKGQLVPLVSYFGLDSAGIQKLSESESLRFASDIERMGSSLAEKLADSSVVIPRKDLSELVSFVAGFNGETGKRFLTEWRRYEPFLFNLKAALLAPSVSEIRPDQWRTMVIEGTSWLSLQRRFEKFFLEEATWSRGPGLTEFATLGREMLGLARRAAVRAPGHAIAIGDIERMILSFPDKLPVTARTLAVTTRVAIYRFFSAGRTHDLDLATIDRLAGAFEEFVRTQRFLEILYAGPGEGASEVRDASVLSVEELFRRAQDKETLRAARAAGISQAVIDRALTLAIEYRSMFEKGTWDIVFRERALSPNRTFFQLTVLNEIDWLSRYFLPGYIRDPKRRPEPLITRHEFDTFFQEMRPLGEEVKFFDPHRRDAALKRVREINLFSFHADGDRALNRHESVELLAYIISARVMANRTHDEIVGKCPDLGLDIFGRKRLERPCYLQNYFSAYRRHWAQMPDLIDYYEKLSNEQRLEFQKWLEAAGRSSDDIYHDVLESRDTEGMSMVLHYVETVFARFDINYNGLIEGHELERMFPVFEQELAGLSKVSDPEVLKGLFFYLLSHGRAPDGKLSFWWWDKWHGNSDVHLDRIRALQIFAGLGNPNTKLN
jgi:hypothetical protein